MCPNGFWGQCIYSKPTLLAFQGSCLWMADKGRSETDEERKSKVNSSLNLCTYYTVGSLIPNALLTIVKNSLCLDMVTWAAVLRKAQPFPGQLDALDHLQGFLSRTKQGIPCTHG